jgi:hypothetical protein
MGSRENVKRLYLDYLNAGFKKDVIARKLKAQFPGANFTFKGSTLYVAFGLNGPQKVLGTELNAPTRLEAASLHDKLKGLGQSFQRELEKNGARGVEVTFISDSEINICTPDKRSFDKAIQIMKKVQGLHFVKQDVFEDEDLDAPEYMAWFKF